MGNNVKNFGLPLTQYSFANLVYTLESVYGGVGV